MASFPVSSSILSAPELANFIQQHYKFSDTATCNLIKAGINHTYLIKDLSGKYIFRIYSCNWRSKQEIEEELKLIHHLKENKIPVSYPIADNQGVVIQELSAPEGNRFAVLFSYANGEKLLDYSLETHEKVGEVMATIHQLTLNYKLDRIDYNEDSLLITPFPRLRNFLSENSEEMIFMQSLQQQLLNELRAADQTKLRKGAVHLDIWFDNLNVNAHDEITIFDFDFCGNGWLCLDIAYYLMQLYVIEINEDRYLAKLQSFLKGYESVTTINDEEKSLLHTLGVSLYFFYLGIQCERFENWSNVFLNETYLKRYIVARVKKYADYQQFNNIINQ